MKPQRSYLRNHIYSVVHILLLYTMQFPYVFDNTPDFVRGILGIYNWQQFDSWSILRDELWPVLIGLIALSTGFLLVTLNPTQHAVPSQSQVCTLNLTTRNRYASGTTVLA